LGILAVVVVLVVLFGIYSAIEISSLQNEVSSLEAQDSNQQQQVAGLQNQVSNLQSQVAPLLKPTHAETFSVKLTAACLSLTPSCDGAYVYSIGILNNGNITIPVDYSVYLSFKDGSRGGVYFNATIPQAILPGQNTSLVAISWPPNANATTILRPGDTVGIGILIGAFETGEVANVQNATAE